MGTPSVAELMRAAPQREFWRSITDCLRIGTAKTDAWRVPGAAAGERDRLRRLGYARVTSVVPLALTEKLASALRSLHAADIPTPAVFVFDEAWELAAGIAPVIELLLGAPPRLLPDVWAWLVEAPASGWAPHRGVTYDVRDDAGSPTLVNAWVSLSDVGEENACMHVVPLPSDSHYPAALDRIDVATSRALALPVPAGSVLAWNANVLHWGGSMRAGASARMSASFSFSTVAQPGDRRPDAPPTFEERIDLLSEMLVAYAHVAALSGPWLEWASLWSGMRRARA